MSIHIYCKGIDILHVKNSIFGFLHDGIKFIIESGNLPISKNLEKMLDEMDQNIYGGGAICVDVADYLTTKEELLIFADLVKRAIEKEHKEYPFIPEALERLWNFHKELLKYS